MMDAVSQIVKYNGLSAGRDKLCRLCQYVSKYAQWYVTQGDNKDLAQKFKSLENSLSGSRKVLRLGKSLDMIQSAVRSTAVSDPVVRTCLIISKLHQACYLLVDHYVWATKIGLTSANSKQLSKTASKFWLVSLVSNLVRNVYDIVNILLREKRRQEKQTGSISRSPDVASPARSGLQSVLAQRPLVVDTMKNLADLLLPLTNLGVVDTPVPVQAVLGIIGSVIGIMVVWNPALKLKP